MVRMVQQVIVQSVDAVTQHQHSARESGNGLCGLRVAGDDSELFADCAKLPGVNQYAARVVVVVGGLGQHDGPALVVVDPFGGQLVMRECVGHFCLSVNQAGEKAGRVCGQSPVGSEVVSG